MHSERGLTYYEVALSGHMLADFFPCLIDTFTHHILQGSTVFTKGTWVLRLLSYRLNAVFQAAFQIMQFLMGFREDP